MSHRTAVEEKTCIACCCRFGCNTVGSYSNWQSVEVVAMGEGIVLLTGMSHHGHDDFVGFPHRKAHSLSTREFLLVLGHQVYQLSEVQNSLGDGQRKATYIQKYKRIGKK